MSYTATAGNSLNAKDVQNQEKTKNFSTHDRENNNDPGPIKDQGSSGLMGGENNLTGNSADRQGDANNSSGGSYRKSNKDI